MSDNIGSIGSARFPNQLFTGDGGKRKRESIGRIENGVTFTIPVVKASSDSEKKIKISEVDPKGEKLEAYPVAMNSLKPLSSTGKVLSSTQEENIRWIHVLDGQQIIALCKGKESRLIKRSEMFKEMIEGSKEEVQKKPLRLDISSIGQGGIIREIVESGLNALFQGKLVFNENEGSSYFSVVSSYIQLGKAWKSDWLIEQAVEHFLQHDKVDQGNWERIDLLLREIESPRLAKELVLFCIESWLDLHFDEEVEYSEDPINFGSYVVHVNPSIIPYTETISRYGRHLKEFTFEIADLPSLDEGDEGEFFCDEDYLSIGMYICQHCPNLEKVIFGNSTAQCSLSVPVFLEGLAEANIPFALMKDFTVEVTGEDAMDHLREILSRPLLALDRLHLKFKNDGAAHLPSIPTLPQDKYTTLDLTLPCAVFNQLEMLNGCTFHGMTIEANSEEENLIDVSLLEGLQVFPALNELSINLDVDSHILENLKGLKVTGLALRVPADPVVIRKACDLVPTLDNLAEFVFSGPGAAPEYRQHFKPLEDYIDIEVKFTE